MINFNPGINPSLPKTNVGGLGGTAKTTGSSGFADTVKAAKTQLGKVDDLQQASDVSIKEMLAGRNEDITSVVSSVAKADMSFKLLIGVRNKLVEAYKETMNMPL